MSQPLVSVVLVTLAVCLAGCGDDPAPGALGGSGLTVPTLRDDLAMTAYRHPAGFTFQYPKGWDLREGDEALAIVPDDAKKDARGQPRELFLVGGQEAEGVRRPDDPDVGAFFDGRFPQLRRKEGIDALSTLVGPGAVYAYENETRSATIYVTLHDGIGIFLAHVCEKELAADRRAVARRVFSTFGWGRGQLDDDLVGVWRRTESSSSDVTAAGYVGSSSTRIWRFAGDGRFAYGSNTRVFGHVSGGGGQVTLDPSGKGGGESGGRWYVEGKRLTLLWNEGGVHVYEYSVFAHTEGRTALKLLVPGEKKPDFYIKQ